MRIIDKEILRLAIPSIVSNVTMPLMGLVDLAIVGHLGSARYIAAISVGTMIFNLIYWVMGFLRMGTSGMTGQALGAGDGAGLRLLLRRSLTVSMAMAAAFLMLQWPIGHAVLSIIHPSKEVWPLVLTYFNIVIWGAPAVLSMNSLNGWFIGMQDTRVPMVVSVLQNLINIVASLGFVYGMGMKIEGVALGTLVAQWCGVMMALFFMRRLLRKVKPSDTDRPLPKDIYSWKAFFTVNRDIFLRTLCLVSVNVAFTSFGARQGDMMLAVNTLLMTFYTLFSYCMDGFAFAGEALAGRYYGARDHEGLREVIRSLFRHWGFSLAGAFTLCYVLGGGQLLQLLTNDAGVLQASHAYFPWVWLIPLAGVSAFIYDGIFVGLTATRGMLMSSFVSALTFFAITLTASLLPASVGLTPLLNHLLWLAFILYLLMRGIMQHRWLRRKRANL